MPTSVLLAVLAAAGLLALAPALVRRYDATERLIAERALSTARVLTRKRRARTVPGRRPVNPPSWLLLSPSSGDAMPARPVPRPRVRHRPGVYRRRQVLAALVLLNLVQVLGVFLVGPGFWISVTVTSAMLLLYLGHLRGQALRLARRRRAEARREAARLLEEELLRAQEAMRVLAEQAAAVAQAEQGKRVATISYRPVPGVRGRAYEVGPAA